MLYACLMLIKRLISTQLRVLTLLSIYQFAIPHFFLTMDDLCGSDHFPLFLNNIASVFEEPTKKWKLNKADWPFFKTLCESDIN